MDCQRIPGQNKEHQPLALFQFVVDVHLGESPANCNNWICTVVCSAHICALRAESYQSLCSALGKLM